MKELIILGSGGWIPTPKRETCCYLFRTEKTLLFLDAGSGMSNLFDYSDIIKDYDEINIVLSHYHLDHIIGLSFLLNWVRNDQKIFIWGPGAPYYNAGCKQILSTIIGGDYFSRRIDSLTEHVEIKDFPDNQFKINEISLEVYLQSHSSPSFGIKLNNDLYYATDTAVKKETFLHSKDCKLVLHECWDLYEEECTGKHSSLEELLRIVPKNKEQSIRLIHINPNWCLETEKKIAQIIDDRDNFQMATDFEVFNFAK